MAGTTGLGTSSRCETPYVTDSTLLQKRQKRPFRRSQVHGGYTGPQDGDGGSGAPDPETLFEIELSDHYDFAPSREFKSDCKARISMTKMRTNPVSNSRDVSVAGGLVDAVIQIGQQRARIVKSMIEALVRGDDAEAHPNSPLRRKAMNQEHSCE
jgi:hypothetical protein